MENITDAIRKRIRQVLFRMLRETDFLTKDNQINTTAISPALIRSIFQTILKSCYCFLNGNTKEED
ncbi:MAG: DUF1819 family protein [Fibrobacter sp.]|nr:DUF1819 family protein [Fibrobacter sp.]